MKKYDKHYTSYNLVKFCCKLFNKYVKVNKNDLVIEPSAGNGAFLKCIKRFKNILLMDIKPEHSKIKKQNYLKYNYIDIINKYNNIYIIGNPPFGKKSSLAIKFIKHSCKFCKSFAFILPKSFEKNSLQKTIPFNFHLIKSVDLPENSFNLPIKCVFQIWKKMDYDRKKIHKIKPNKNYKFVNKFSNPTVAIRRVGSKAGYLYYDNIENKNENTHYFIKINKKFKKIVKINIKESKYTLGPNSISKMSIIKKLNRIII
jgi:hypothetical protein